MTLLTALLLLGQVGTPSEIGVPRPVPGISPAVRIDDTEEVQQPLRPSAQEPLRPEAGATIEAPPSSAPAAMLRDGTLRDGTLGERPAFDPPPAISRPTTLSADEPVPDRFGSRSSATAAPRSAAPAVPAAVPQDPQAWQIAGSMMEQILTMDEQPASPQRRMRLQDTLSRNGDSSLSAVAIQAYWDLARSIAASRFASDKVRLLTEVTRPVADSDQALLAESLAAAEADEAAAEDRLVAAQYELLRVTGLPPDEGLPWPADAPLVAPYRTQFSTIFATRPAPLSLRQIHHRLPGKLSLIEKRLTAMSAAEGAFDALNAAYQGGRSPLVPVLGSIERLDRSRHEFLSAIVEYNQQIAEYSLAVVGPGVGPETLVATLIPTVPAAGTLVDIPRDVRQAAAAEPARGELRYR